MSRTLLNEVNVVLKKAGLIQGSTGEITTLTVSALQVDIDNIVKAVNTAMLDLARAGVEIGLRSESSITLVATQREYTVAATFIEMADTTLIDETNGQRLTPYPGGFYQMRNMQVIPANFTGLPIFWTINPTNGKIRIDTAPTASDAGRIYKYIYKGTLLMSAATDVFPLKDDAVEALEDCIEQQYSRHRKGQFDQAAYQTSIGRAAQIALQFPQQSDYGVRVG